MCPQVLGAAREDEAALTFIVGKKGDCYRCCPPVGELDGVALVPSQVALHTFPQVRTKRES